MSNDSLKTTANEIKTEIRDDLRGAVEELRRLRDEIRLQANLASKEAKSTWSELEPKLHNLEAQLAKGGAAAAEATTALVEDLGRSFKDFRDRLVG